MGDQEGYQDRKQRYEQAAKLLDQWFHESSHYDSVVYPQIAKLLDVDDGYSKLQSRITQLEAAVKKLQDTAVDVAHEAHEIGRVYTAGGEKRKPAEQFGLVTDMVHRRLGIGKYAAASAAQAASDEGEVGGGS